MLHVRIFLLSALAALVSAGLIGCAVFTASAGHVHASPQAIADAAMDMHAHNGAHGHHAGINMAGDQDAPADHSACDGSARTLLNRAAMTLDAGVLQDQLPVPVLVTPASVTFVDSADVPRRTIWPPGDEPPTRPLTLTHLKISLLI